MKQSLKSHNENEKTFLNRLKSKESKTRLLNDSETDYHLKAIGEVFIVILSIFFAILIYNYSENKSGQDSLIEKIAEKLDIEINEPNATN